MAKGRDLAAESVGELLDLTRSRRQNGLLSVEHTQAGLIEEGEIFFQAGQPTYARAGQLIGQVALARMLRWRQIHYIFIADAPLPPFNVLSAGNVTSNAAISTQPTTAVYQRFEGRTQTVEPSELDRSQARNSQTSNSFPSTTSLEAIAPQKRGNEREVLLMPLTRRQRFIYFLVDGRRTLNDLARCTGKNVHEVELILRELHEQGLVSF